ncbi:MAG: amino acid ABC transporter permease [bacterium]
MYQIDFWVIYNALPAILKGLEITLIVSIISAIIAFGLGVVLAFCRRSKSFVLKTIAAIYVEIHRNTPLLIQLYIYYKGLPNIGITLNPMLCGILSLSLYTAAFICEVVRSGLSSVANEQYQAARALGLNAIQTYRIIILPQAIRIILPALTNQFINLIKNSSLVSFIAVTDLFYVIYKGAADDFRFVEFFVTGAVIYMILTGSVAFIASKIDNMFKIPGRSIKI